MSFQTKNVDCYEIITYANSWGQNMAFFAIFGSRADYSNSLCLCSMKYRKHGICDTSFYLKNINAIMYQLNAVSYQVPLRSFRPRRSVQGLIIEKQRTLQYVWVSIIGYLITLLGMMRIL